MEPSVMNTAQDQQTRAAAAPALKRGIDPVLARAQSANSGIPAPSRPDVLSGVPQQFRRLLLKRNADGTWYDRHGEDGEQA